MGKHIAPPATAEQIMRSLGLTREDREIIDRVLKEVDEEERYAMREDDPAGTSCSSVQPPIQRLDPDAEDDSFNPRKEPKS